MQQALDALEMYELETDSDTQRKAIAALRERLAQPEQKPVAHCAVRPLRGDQSYPTTEIIWVKGKPIAGPLFTTPPAAQQEPTKEMIDAAERIDWADSDVRGNIVNMWQAMLAAAPAQPAPVQPEQEPDAFALRTKKHGLEFNSGYGMVETLEQAQEMQRRHMGDLEIVELRAFPPAAQQKPLTTEAIRAGGGIIHKDGNVFFTNLEQLNQAIEAAHGIKEKNNG
jgi:hypothetical protein